MNATHAFILIDSGIMVAFYNRKDRYHQQVVHFFSILLIRDRG